MSGGSVSGLTMKSPLSISRIIMMPGWIDSQSDWATKSSAPSEESISSLRSITAPDFAGTPLARSPGLRLAGQDELDAPEFRQAHGLPVHELVAGAGAADQKLGRAREQLAAQADFGSGAGHDAEISSPARTLSITMSL